MVQSFFLPDRSFQEPPLDPEQQYVHQGLDLDFLVEYVVMWDDE